MAALTEDRQTPTRSGEKFSQPVAASTIVYAGGMCQLVSGYAKPVAAGQVGPVTGIFTEQVDNSAGADAALNVEVEPGIHRMDNSDTNALTMANVGQPCYAEDDATVGSSPDYPLAGKVIEVDDQGVWVEMFGAGMDSAITGVSKVAATQTLLAATPLVFDPFHKYYPVAGSGGAVTLTADFPAGSYAGQEIVIVGTHDTNKVTITTAINTKTIDGLSVELADDCYVPFVYDGADWVQTGPMVHNA